MTSFFGEHRQFRVLFDAFFLLAFQFAGMCQQLLDRAVLGNQFLGRFRTDAGDTGNVVTGVAHQPQDVDHLVDPFDLPFLQHFLDAKDFGIRTATSRFVDETCRRSPVGHSLCRA